jgi:hypothetical protein
MTYLGDFATEATVLFPWSSQDAAGAAVTATLAASSVEIYKDGGTTQRASDAGVTSTIDFDSKTGAHLVEIDLSDDSDSGFYAAGSDYQVLLEATVAGQTVRIWRSFSIENRFMRGTDGATKGADVIQDASKSGVTGGLTRDGALRIQHAVKTGPTSGGGTTITDHAGSAVVTGTVASKDRSSVTVTDTGA